MAKRRSWSGPVPADEQRCTRNDGKNWRCYAPRSPGSIFCPKHHLAYLAKCRPNPNPKPPTIRGPHKNPFRRRPTTTATATAARVSRTPPPLTPGEIWAFSNNSPSDQTPRHYARIDRTLPTILATPLIPHPILPEELLLTDTQNRTLSCGTFRPSPRKTAMHPSSFVFRMVGFKIITWMGIPFYRLFPNKGEVWAVSAKEGGGEVKMVEVVSDFSEDDGVTVAGLVPIEGKGDGVYGRHLHEGFRLVQTFGRREMVAFSHRVEAERVEGCEGDQQLWKVMA